MIEIGNNTLSSVVRLTTSGSEMDMQLAEQLKNKIEEVTEDIDIEIALLPTTLPPTSPSPTTTIPTSFTPTTPSPTTLLPTTVPPTSPSPTTTIPTSLAPTTPIPPTQSPATPSPPVSYECTHQGYSLCLIIHSSVLLIVINIWSNVDCMIITIEIIIPSTTLHVSLSIRSDTSIHSHPHSMLLLTSTPLILIYLLISVSSIIELDPMLIQSFLSNHPSSILTFIHATCVQLILNFNPT